MGQGVPVGSDVETPREHRVKAGERSTRSASETEMMFESKLKSFTFDWEDDRNIS